MNMTSHPKTSTRIFKHSKWRASIVALMMTVSIAQAQEVVYLSGKWFHKADSLNFLTTPGGSRLAVDNDGKHIADLLGSGDRNVKIDFDSLYEHDGIYYIARDLGNHGYDYIPLGKRGNLLSIEQVLKQRLWGKPQFRVMGHHFDADPMRGSIGMSIFPDAGMAIVCGQSQWDSRSFAMSAFRQGDEKLSNSAKIDLPIYSGAKGSVRSEDMPDRVFVDEPAKGFWYLGTRRDESNGRQLALAFATPVRGEGGVPSLKLSKVIELGGFAQEKFEAGVVIGDQLFLLMAQKDPSIGGVKSLHRLLRIDRATLGVQQVETSFDEYLDDLRIAAFGNDVALHSTKALRVIDGDSLKVRWDYQPASGQPIYQIEYAAANAKGDQLAVGLTTPYRKAGESTRVLIFDTKGKQLKAHQLKPGSIDRLVHTDDGGLLVLSAHYTAKIGGTVDVKANEAAAIAKADRGATAEAAANETPAKPYQRLETPLNERFKVWFDKPTGGFGQSSLPIGNGHMGVMLDGGTHKANIIFNVDSQWTGDSRNMGAYQGFGEISAMFNHDPKKVTDYRRELDLRTGIHSVRYVYNGIQYKREAFCSYPTGLLAIRFTADKPAAYSGDIRLMSMHPAKFSKSKDGIEFAGAIAGNKRKFKGVMKLQTDGGQVLPEAGKDGEDTVNYRRRYKSVRPYNTVRVEGVNSITLYLAADTDYSPDASKEFRGDDPADKIAPRLANIQKFSFKQMKQASAADVATLFDRCTLDLATPNPDAEALPIDERKKAYARGDSDPGFEALVFAAQRHMMIACSRPGSLPANLQGIWNNSNWPAWTSDYHSDINIQMAYWFTEPANLAECNDALFDYMESQIPVRRLYSKELYGKDVRGWNVHFMNNIFGGYSYKDFPGGSAWYAQHFAEHFKFNQDRAYLEKRAFPVLQEISQHWQDLLIERPNGKLVTPKTMSPEHKPEQFGISQDLQLVHNLFTDYLAASKRLNDSDSAFHKQVADMRERLLPIQIGRWGQIQEWERDRDSRYSTHRHHHQMIAAFPGSQITTETPELAEAVVTGLEARGTGGTGWSQVWRINLFARLGRPDLAYRQVRVALPSFHDHLIWQSKSQIDAPAGYASGVCEMLLQSHRPLADDDSRFLIELLPALPTAWPSGRVKGLRARGGFEVDIEWADGKLTTATLRNINSPTDQAQVRYGDRKETLTVPRGKQVVFK